MADMFDKEELSIVGGLFPNALATAEAEKQSQQELAYKRFSGAAGTQNPFAGLAGLSGMFGATAGQELRGLAGAQSPTMQLVSLRNQATQQFDTRTPEGLMQMAQFLNQQGDAAGARQAIMVAQGQQQRTAQLQKTQMDVSAAERKVAQDEKLREALAALPANATEEQFLSVFRQFGTPDQQARIIQESLNRKAQLAARASAESTLGTAGPVGKSGAYRDISGNVYGPPEMKVVRTEFKGAQDLLDTLNQISAQDVRNAESFVDWTTKSSEVKSLASKKTLTAQSKIALSQLMQQIESLPPGSASDADMRAAMKNFPGYGDPDALADWINNTKARLQRTIARTSDQFGFKPTVTSSGNIDLKSKPAAGGVSTSDMDLINKYSTPQPAAQR